MKVLNNRWAATGLIVLSLLTNLAAAAEKEQQAPPPTGAETRAWLQLQSSGAQAAPSPQQPGDVASRTYQRYLQSFEWLIPESFFADKEGPVKQ